jgi:teichuronic acid biosynthesis glycosyltransferase TuaG
MSQPRFSVIMPLYNHAPYVRAAVDSVLAQSFADFELVICNDGSTDGSLEAVQGYTDPRVRWIDKPNGGTVSALNACLMESRGSFICWLSSDDLFSPDKLLTHHRHHAENPESTLSVAPFGYLSESQWIPASQIRAAPRARLLQFVYGNYINGLSVCAHRVLYTLYGLFDERYRFAHDVERWFSFFRHQEPVFIEGPAQSHTRLNTGNTADAGLLGELDVLKFLCHALRRNNLQGLLLAEEAATELASDTLVGVFEWLFNSGNLFHRFHMRSHLIDLVAHSLGAATQGAGLSAAVAALQARDNDPRTAEILAALAEVGTAVAQPGVVRPRSFVDHLVRLRDSVNSPEQREIIERYLKTGF